MAGRKWNWRQHRLHAELKRLGLDQAWLNAEAVKLVEDAAAMKAILYGRILPEDDEDRVTQNELARSEGIPRARLRVVEGWLLRRLHGRMRHFERRREQ